MFAAFGRLVTRFPWLWIAGWLIVLVAFRMTAPSWESVSSEGELQHLPDDVPSRRANELFNEAFPEERSESNIVLIMRRSNGELGIEDYVFMALRVVPRLYQIAERHGGVIQPSMLARLEEALGDQSLAPKELAEELKRNAEERTEAAEVIQQATTPEEVESAATRIVAITAPHNSLIGPLLVSGDQHAMLVLMPLTSQFLTSKNYAIIRDVEESVVALRQHEKKPEGLEIYVTGSAILGRDVVEAVTESTDAIEAWTVWLVLALLLITFRSPVVALIPLVTLYVAVTISLDLLAVLAGGGVIDIFDGLQIYATVLIYGAGVDYGMFLISRFREELSHGERVRQGLAIAIAKVGIAIVVSAGTEIIGVGVLSLADFGKFAQAGVAVPICLIITLFASLTLTVALLRITGRWGFWPQHLAFRSARTNITGDRPEQEVDVGYIYRFWAWVGRQVRARPVLVWGATVGLMAPFCVWALLNHNNVTYDMTSGLPRDAPSLQGNAILQEHFSRGVIGPITILLRNDQIDFGSKQGTTALLHITRELLQHDTQFQIADLQVLIRPAGTSPRARDLLDQLEQILPGRWDRITKVEPSTISEEQKKEIVEDLEYLILQNAKQYYVSQSDAHKGHVTRMTLVLNADPFSKQSIVSIDNIREHVVQALPEAMRGATTVAILGPTASLYDVRTTAERDRSFMYVWVTIAVLAILILLLRKLVISIYLVATVILTYLATMGVTYLLFQWIDGDSFSGLQWTVPTLLFTLLMAVGADFNVLLVERFEEERTKHGAGEATVKSLATTGGLISGAGIVMAGTFLALNLGGTLDSMQQLGFALAFGVLIDTFLIRPLLVPSFLLVFIRLLNLVKRKREPAAGADAG